MVMAVTMGMTIAVGMSVIVVMIMVVGVIMVVRMPMRMIMAVRVFMGMVVGVTHKLTPFKKVSSATGSGRYWVAGRQLLNALISTPL